MSEEETALHLARARAEAARVDVRNAADALFGWFSPARLKAEAAIAATQQIDEAKAALRRQVRSHPLAAWSALAVGATLLTYLLRRPALALARSGADAARALYARFTRRKV